MSRVNDGVVEGDGGQDGLKNRWQLLGFLEYAINFGHYHIPAQRRSSKLESINL